MSKVLAQRLRHRVNFLEQVETKDSEGAVSITWEPAWLDSDTELSNVPAEVLTGPGREFNAGGKVQAETSARITLRWFNGLDPAWRIEWDGHIYNIGSIETDATGRREYRLRCTGGVNDGQ